MKKLPKRSYNEELYRDEWQWQEGDLTVTRNCQWSGPGCHEGCGVLHYTDKDGRVVKIEGDPKSPVYNGRLCMRCMAVPEAMYDKMRVTNPLKRVGARGENKWEEITWDEAYDIIEENAKRLSAEYGPKTIAVLQGTGRNTSWQAAAIANVAYQTPNLMFGFLAGDSCYVPRLVGMSSVAGDASIMDCAQMFEDRYDNPQYVIPKICIVWGNNPIISNGDGFMGHWIVDLMRMGTELIVVDPRLTWMAGMAKYWLRIRPGTDGALALAMINIIIEEDLYDHEFVDNWCYGFDQLKERAAAYPLDVAERITTIPAELIQAAAREYATAKPAAIQWGLALDQQKHGLGANHAIQALWAITGNVDVPGGNIIVTSGYIQADVRTTFQWDVPEAYARLGNAESKLRSQGMDNSAATEILIQALETGVPYPVKMIHCTSSNTFANMGADADRVYKAMLNAEFIVVSDLYLTPTAVGTADIFLPVAMSAERKGVRGWWAPIRAINKVSDFANTKSDEEIALDIGRRMNPEAFQWDTLEEMWDDIMNNLQSVNFEDGEPFSYEDLKKRVYRYEVFEYKKYEKGLLRADGQLGFNTPTGRLELWCTTLSSCDLEPLPYFEEPEPSPNSTPDYAHDYPLILTTGHRSWEFFHSEHRNLKSMREFHPWPLIDMHPDTAAKYGIKEGDWVLIENHRGSALEVCRFNPSMDVNVVSAEHGWWFPEREPALPVLYGVFESNINMLTPADDVGPSGLAAPYSTQMCRISKAEGYVPPEINL